MSEHKLRELREAQQSSAASQSAATDMYKSGIDLFRKGVERNIEIQKNVLERASQQNAETIDLWRTMFRSLPGAEPILNFTEQTVENFIGMRRRYLEIMCGQYDEMADSAKTQGERTARAAHEMTTPSEAA